jgi:hypothetical protein
LPKRKDPITRSELYTYLISKVCTITYTPEGSGRRTIRVTLIHEHIKELDNFPMGFESIYETAMFELHSITCLDIDNNSWVSIPVNSIQNIQVP